VARGLPLRAVYVCGGGARNPTLMDGLALRLDPVQVSTLDDAGFDSALTAIADFVDLKSPYTLGHAAAVAELTADAGEQLGLAAPEVRTLRRAGLVHDLGSLGVSTAIWDKSGPLGAGEWERIRLHPCTSAGPTGRSSAWRSSSRRSRSASTSASASRWSTCSGNA
jgi:HD-GYP domain-containing protein (c-di-GMP phosphodiesterase class II)